MRPLYESLGTHFINYDLDKDKVLDNPKRVRLGSWWRPGDPDDYDSLAQEKDDIVLLRVYKKRPHIETGEYILIKEKELNEHFKKIW